MIKEYKELLEKIGKKRDRKLNDHVLLVDGMNTFIRSFSVIKTMNPKGHHIGGLLGFLRSLGYLTRVIDPTRIICIFDGKGSTTNRKNVDPNYKANRDNVKITNWGLYDTKKEEHDSLVLQRERLFDYLECLPVQSVNMDKLEADDVIAFLAKSIASAGKKVTIVSSDQDFLQLVSKNIEIYSPIRKTTFTTENTKEFLNVLPENFNIIKALTGDKSDNVPGIKGVGVKSLIKEFPELATDINFSLDSIYEQSAKRVDKKLLYAKIIDSWDRILMNFDLMDLNKDILDENEKEELYSILTEPIPKLRSGAFLRLLDVDEIEGITKNTPAWLQTFQSLTLYQ